MNVLRTVFVFLLLVLITGLSAQNLVAHYPFDGNANDQSGNGIDGTVYNAQPTEDRFGNANSAYYFDGNGDYIDVGTNADFKLLHDGGSFTSSIWVKHNSSSTSQYGILGSTIGGDRPGIYLSVVGKDVRWIVGRNTPSPVVQITENVFNDGDSWNHIVVTYDNIAEEYEVFINNTSIGTYIPLNAHENANSFYTLKIGCSKTTPTQAWTQGSIDDFRVYSRVLSKTEISDLFTEGGWNSLANGLVAHYTFEGNADDQSGNNNHGTENGGVTYTTDRFGNANSAASFDGVDDWIEVADLDPYSSFTYSAWVNIQGGTGERDILTKSNQVQMYLSPNEELGWFNSGSPITSGGNVIGSTSEHNRWYHITGTSDGSQQSLYIDGVFVGSRANTTGAQNDINLAIGCYLDDLSSPQSFWNGLIDDIRIYNRALSASEITDLYTTESGLIAHYTFDGSAQDQSGNNNHGTENGGLTYTEDRFGNANGAASFDGVDDYVDIPNPYDNDVFTIKAWVKIDPTDLGTGNTIVEGWKDGEFLRMGYGYYDLSVAPSFLGYIGAGLYTRGSVHAWANNSSLYQERHLFEPVTASSDWKLLTISYAFPYMSSYLNGELVEQVDVSGLPTNSPGFTKATYISTVDLLIGLNKDNEYFEGVIDDIEFYNRALSASEIADLYTSESGLVAHYTFDGNADDQSGNNNHGTENGGVTYTTDRFGNANGAASFDGVDDYVDVTYPTLNADAFTKSIWFKLNSGSTQTSGITEALFGGRTGTTTKIFNIFPYNDASEYELSVQIDGGTADRPSLNHAGNYYDDTWHNLFISSSSDEVNYYLDGDLISTVTQVTSGTLSDNHVVGAYNDNGSIMHHIEALIDDIRIYNRALSASEITDLYIEGGWPIYSSETDIITFSIPEETGTAAINSNNHTVDIEVQYGTGLTAVTPTITLSSGATVSPLSNTQQNFTNPVTYTVTAEDGITTQDWTVAVTAASNNATDILTFSLPEQSAVANIDEVNHTISLPVIYGTDITLLTPTISLSNGATVSPLSGVTNDFGNSADYTVTALDGTTTQVWTVTVTEASNTEADFTAFDLQGNADINVNSGVITTYIPYGTDKSNLSVASYTLSEQANVLPDPSLLTNFTTVQTVTVTAGDGSTRDWTIIVEHLPNTDTKIISYSIDGQIGTIDNASETISITIPYSLKDNLSTLVADFELPFGASSTVGLTPQVSGTTINDFTTSVFYQVTSEDGSTQTWEVIATLAPSDETTITAFNIPGMRSMGISGTNITVVMPYGTNVTALAPSISTIDNPDIQPASGVEQDFSEPIEYLVTAEDGVSTTTYTIIVNVEPNTDSGIDISSEFATEDPNKDPIAGTINMEVPYGTSLESFSLGITLPDQATAFIDNVTLTTSGSYTGDFSSMKEIRVTAGDGTSTTWTVTILAAKNTNTTISNFDIVDGEINQSGNTITVLLPYGHSLTSLTPTFILPEGAISQPASGTAINFTNGEIEYIVTAEAGNIEKYIVHVSTVEDIKAPEVTPFSTIPTEIYSDDITVTFVVTDDHELSSVSLFYKGATAPVEDYTSIEKTANEGDGDNFSFTLTPSMSDEAGILFYILASDATGNSNEKIDSFVAKAFTESESPPIPNLTADGTFAGYQMIAIPFVLENNSVEAIFDELGTYDINIWRMFHYINNDTREYGDFWSTIEIGKGYWFNRIGNKVVNIGRGKSEKITEKDPKTLFLKDGWNQIGNPYNFAIDWDDVRDQNPGTELGVLHKWKSDGNQGGYKTDNNILQPFEGAFVKSTGDATVIIPVRRATGGRFTEDRFQQNPIDADEWYMPLHISNGLTFNHIGGIGMMEGAEEGEDEFDEYGAPGIGNLVNLNFSDNQKIKIRDITSRTDTKTWSFSIHANQGDKISLNWDNSTFGENSMKLYLFHKSRATIINMRKSGQYSFINNGFQEFHIIYGNKNYIDNEVGGDKPMLGIPYPNPFNHEVHFTFTLPAYAKPYTANLEILDLSGKIISEMSSEGLTDGFNKFIWTEGISTSKIPAGVLIYRIKIEGSEGQTWTLYDKVIKY